MLKKILHVLFSKSFVFGVLAILQLGIIFLLVYNFAQLGVIAYTVLIILTVLAAIAVFERDNLNPAYKIMWISIFVVIPVFGVVFYFLWGSPKVPGKKRKQLIKAEQESRAFMVQDAEILQGLKESSGSIFRSAKYLWRAGFAPIYPVEEVVYYPLGEDFFPDFLEAIGKAEKYIYMEYFIVEEGYMWDAILDILKERAEAGVDVRFMYDGLGSIATLHPLFPRQLAEMGIQCFAFSPIEFDLSISEYGMLNHRDHRKMTIIDGEVAFSGGLNLADEYINKLEKFGVWKDTTFKTTGASVYSFVTTFLHMWSVAANTPIDYDDYPKPVLKKVEGSSLDALENGFIQPYYDSPLDSESVAKNAYMNIINTAQDYVYIVTPYLILDYEMISSLALAAKSGVDVRIITPGIPDKRAVFMLTQSYYQTLIKGGVRIYEYKPGFMHAKMYVSDDNIAVVGSANMDYRSLYLHFENCASFYGGQMPGWVKQDVLDTFEVSQEVSLEDTQKVGFFKRAAQIVVRFFAPLM